MNKSFNIFFEKYISKLTNSLNNSDRLSIEKAASKIYETIKKRIQFSAVVTVDLLQLQIIIFVII